ncbi:MAG TPA: hypothetical protein VHU42_07025 [Rhodopila sp.]|jgi:hypothetical protein|nr:hypothetical protein [Rhodopila sp.]
MKPLLALVTLALTSLIFEEKARQLAGDTQDAYHAMVTQACDATKTLTDTVERRPLTSLLTAGGLAYLLATIIPSRG